MALKPTLRAWHSWASCLPVVPPATSEWNPEIAPQAMVMNIIGQIRPRLLTPSARLNDGTATRIPEAPVTSRETTIRATPP